jgi:uncharacterized protein YndB with AHSA1/START domain/predicted transcriptional regulator YdeE
MPAEILEKPNVTTSLAIVRHYKAKVEDVWAAWTQPEKVMRWWGPSNSDAPVAAEADVRVGGRFRFAFREAGGETHDVSGVYREVVLHRKLAFTWAWRSTPERESIVTLEFRDLGGETEFTLRHEQLFDEPARDRHHAGWTGALEKLGASLGSPNGVAPERIETRAPMTIVGLQQRYTMETRKEIPELWTRFAPRIGAVPGQIGMETYGVSSAPASGEGFDYMAGIAVSDAGAAPKDLATLRLEAPRYAVFKTNEGFEGMHRLLERIGAEWTPLCGPALSGPYLIERYGAAFDPMDPSAEIEIWIALPA